MSGSRRRKLARQIGAKESPKLPGPCPPDLPGSRQALVAMLVIAAATVLAYSNSFDASFHFDDLRNIVRNQSLRELGRQWPPSGNRWVGFLSFALNYRFGGLEVFGYHLVNLLIHVCNGLLVFWLAAITLRTPALRSAEAGPLVRGYLPLAAGLLFALHPVQTQAVTYIVQRFASLATLLFLVSLALYAQARLSLEADRPSKRSARFLYCLSIVAAGGAMKTKEISFTLPFVAAGYEWLLFRPRRRLLLLVPLAATALLVPLGLAIQDQNLVLADASHVVAETPLIPRSVYLLTQSRVVVTYLRLLLLPVGQNLDYSFRLSHSLADPGVLLALAILAVVATTAVLLLRRARETNRAEGVLVFLGIGWFFVTLSVESTVIPIRDVIFEHRMYLPSVGAAVAFGTALLWIVEQLALRLAPTLQATVALSITAGSLGVATHARNVIWKDELSLWSDVVAKSPEKARAHNNLGTAYQTRGLPDDAAREHLAAIRIDPEYADAHDNLGNAYKAQGRIDEAVTEYREAIRLAPGSAEAHSNLGATYAANGQIDDAIRECLEAVRLDPRDAGTHNNLGNAYKAKGRLDEAAAEYREALRLAPGLAEAHGNLGNAFLANGRLDEAFSEFREALRLAPDGAGAHYNLGRAHHSRERLDDAVREYREAIRLAPGLACAHTDLGNAYHAKGQIDDAAREYREAIRLEPGRAEAHNNLGSTLMEQGRRSEGIEEFRRALALKSDPEFIFNLALALETVGLRSEAVTQYQRFLDAGSGTYPDLAEPARRSIAQLRAPHQRSSR